MTWIYVSVGVGWQRAGVDHHAVEWSAAVRVVSGERSVRGWPEGQHSTRISLSLSLHWARACTFPRLNPCALVWDLALAAAYNNISAGGAAALAAALPSLTNLRVLDLRECGRAVAAGGRGPS